MDLLIVILVAGLVRLPVPAVSSVQESYTDDFEEFWELVDSRYAYFDAKATDWEQVRERYGAEAAEVESGAEFVDLLERALAELYDHHAHLGTNTDRSPPMVPSQTDLWAVWRGGKATLAAVRPGSPAWRAGLRAGRQITSIDGRPVIDAIAHFHARAMTAADPEAEDYALRVALAGRRGQHRKLGTRSSNGSETMLSEVSLGAFASNWETSPEPLSARRLEGGFGLVRINDSLGDSGLIGAFDRALEELRETRGLVLDLRNTASGGNTVVARGLMGRLIEREGFYQKHSRPSEKLETGIERSWAEIVSPRGPFTYTAPVVVLVDRWTGSMGEGLAIGLDGLGRATVVGTPMAGLLGAIESFELGQTGIPVRFATERLFHVDGTPRESFVPAVLVDLVAAARSAEGYDDDPILEAGLRELVQLTSE